MVAWLVQRCGVAAPTAREWLTAAGKLQELPKIADALAKGRLSFDQVKPLVEVAKPETDATLAEQATRWSAKQVRELATAARHQNEEQATGSFARRFLRFDDGRRSLAGMLPADRYRGRQECPGRSGESPGRRPHAVRPTDGRRVGGALQG